MQSDFDLGWLLRAIVAALAGMALLVVSAWQLSIWFDERERVEAIETALARPVQDLELALSAPPEQQAYLRVRGKAWPARGELYVPDDQNGAGVRVFIPLRLDNSRRRVIAEMGFQRGPPPNEIIPMFVYADEREAMRGGSAIENFPAILYEGVLLPPEPLPADQTPNPERGVWPSADTASMSSEMRVSNAPAAYLYVESAARGKYPKRRFEPRIAGYPAELALAAFLLAIGIPALAFTWGRRRRDIDDV